tara:strand:- start:10649 stop:10891 length:243 start_codon:yes stop_codon:yes gene_type:complete
MAKKKVKSEWNKLIKAVRGDHSKRFNEVLETLPDDEFMVHFPKILEYVIPKLQRVETDKGKEQDTEIKIIHVIGKNDSKD